MRSCFIPQGAYENIINQIGIWKILDCKSLYENTDYGLSYSNFLKKIRKLEKTKFVKSVYVGNKIKHIYLTQKGIKLSRYDSTYEICDENLTHDLITGLLLRRLLEMEFFISGQMFHRADGEKVNPDADLIGAKNESDFKIALEVELTPKTKSRVRQKYGRYSMDNQYNYCLYITNKKGLYKSYKKYLSQMHSDVSKKIILALDEKLSTKEICLEETTCFYLEKDWKFLDLFATKKG